MGSRKSHHICGRFLTTIELISTYAQRNAGQSIRFFGIFNVGRDLFFAFLSRFRQS